MKKVFNSCSGAVLFNNLFTMCLQKDQSTAFLLSRCLGVIWTVVACGVIV